MRKKPWWRSKTLWINVGTIAAGALALPGANEVVGLGGAEVAIVSGVINVALRTLTKDALGGRSNADLSRSPFDR